jgi:hypothetical protein
VSRSGVARSEGNSQSGCPVRFTHSVAVGAERGALLLALTPRWFFERRSVQHREVEHEFFEFLGLSSQRQSVIGSFAEAIADLTGAFLQAASHYRDSRAFVRHMQTL